MYLCMYLFIIYDNDFRLISRTCRASRFKDSQKPDIEVWNPDAR